MTQDVAVCERLSHLCHLEDPPSSDRRKSGSIYHPGQKVWLSTRDIRLPLPCCKLSSCYIGPFSIQRKKNDLVPQTCLLLPSSLTKDPSTIVDSRRRGGQLEYLVDWEGCGLEHCSRFPWYNILDLSLLSEIHNNQPDHPVPRGRRRRRPLRSSGAACEGGGTVTESVNSSAPDAITTITGSQSQDY